VHRILRHAAGLVAIAGLAGAADAQVPPSPTDKAGYTGLLAAAARGEAAQIPALTAKGESPDHRDAHGRTPLHVAAYGGHHEAMRALVAAGANPNAREQDRYDIVTIAAVANDVATLRVALTLGASARNVTSRYDGTWGTWRWFARSSARGRRSITSTISAGRRSSKRSCWATAGSATPTRWPS
jgi:hypothetical protein